MASVADFVAEVRPQEASERAGAEAEAETETVRVPGSLRVLAQVGAEAGSRTYARRRCTRRGLSSSTRLLVSTVVSVSSRSPQAGTPWEVTAGQDRWGGVALDLASVLCGALRAATH